MSNSKSTRDYFSISQTTQVALESSLRDLFLNFSANNDLIAEQSEFIISKYSERHRLYHNLSHVKALLLQAESLKRNFADFETIQFAIWFHDVIYNPKRTDNEIESAKLATEVLEKLRVAKDKIERVEQMILATQNHEARDLDFDGKLFLDLDL